MLFSIIVPIYNVEKYLHQCVDSVLNQTFQDFELILVNDGSPDSCGRIVDTYAMQDLRVVTIHKENGGLVSARKAGARIARGEYVVVLDGDDWLAPDTLERVAEAIKDYEADLICYGYFRAINTKHQKFAIVNQKTMYSKKKIEQEILPNLLISDKGKLITPTLWGKAFKRSLYQKFQQMVDSRITMGEDGAVVFPYVYHAESIYLLPDALYYYRLNPESLTQSKQRQIPWEGALLRIAHFKNCLPLNWNNMEEQLGCYAAHSVFNVILSQLQHKKYVDVKVEALDVLNSNNLIPLIRKARLIGSFPEKLAQIAIANKCFFIIKLYAMIR